MLEASAIEKNQKAKIIKLNFFNSNSKKSTILKIRNSESPTYSCYPINC